MFWGIESERPVPDGLPLVRITLGARARTFTLSMPWSELRTPEGRDLIGAWATTLIALPGSGIELHEIERLMDFLDEHYPIQRGPQVRKSM